MRWNGVPRILWNSPPKNCTFLFARQPRYCKPRLFKRMQVDAWLKQHWKTQRELDYRKYMSKFKQHVSDSFSIRVFYKRDYQFSWILRSFRCAVLENDRKSNYDPVVHCNRHADQSESNKLTTENVTPYLLATDCLRLIGPAWDVCCLHMTACMYM